MQGRSHGTFHLRDSSSLLRCVITFLQHFGGHRITDFQSWWQYRVLVRAWSRPVMEPLDVISVCPWSYSLNTLSFFLVYNVGIMMPISQIFCGRIRILHSKFGTVSGKVAKNSAKGKLFHTVQEFAPQLLDYPVWAGVTVTGSSLPLEAVLFTSEGWWLLRNSFLNQY